MSLNTAMSESVAVDEPSTPTSLLQSNKKKKKKYNPVLFSRRETATLPDLKRATSGAYLIHNVDSPRADSSNSSSHHHHHHHHHKHEPSLNDESDSDESEDGGAARKQSQSFWARCCSLCCGRGNLDDYNEAEDESSDSQEEEVAHLAPLTGRYVGKKTLVLDLDETLVHSSFKEVEGYDLRLKVDLDTEVVQVYVMVRPGTDELLNTLAEHYEIVVYTASLAKYANPLLDMIDKKRVISGRLFREHCAYYGGNYVKDLASLGRRLCDTLIVDNSPASYMFQPSNAIPCTNFIDDKSDRELYDIIDFLHQIKTVPDVSPECLKYKAQWRKKYNNGLPHGAR